jgi:hypothetical protein
MNKLVEKLITNIICTTFFIFILYIQELNWVQNNSILLDLMSFVSNGGKFKLKTVPNGLLFSTPTQPRISFKRMIYFSDQELIY